MSILFLSALNSQGTIEMVQEDAPAARRIGGTRLLLQLIKLSRRKSGGPEALILAAYRLAM
jgi:hypothetical protein